ncbi:MAG TPA: TetR/AcrR family transcriptional regulator [Anaerolineaceae bacterium]|nr:TetR/AcrR family transcriptional regulator [Anaerolineaceae bacterium]
MVRTRDPERKEKFLNAALQLFVAQGVQNTSTAEIAQAAGSAAGTLFLYFPTKQDVIDQLVLRISKAQSAAITALLDPALSARETFAAIWHGSIDWFQAHMDAFLYVQQIRHSKQISEAAVQESAQDLAYYYTAIAKGLSEGAIRPYPPELIGGILYQHITAVMALAGAEPNPAKQQAYIEQGFEIFWNGIQTGDHNPQSSVERK